MKLNSIFLFPLIGMASIVPSVLAAAVPNPAGDKAQTGLSLSSNLNFVTGLTLDMTAGESCKNYKDCVRCKPGYWRCCFAGCHGQKLPGYQTCGCVQDGKDLGPSCGCT